MQLLKVLAAVAAGAIVIVCAVVLLAPAGAFAATGAIAQVPQVGQAAPPEPERCVTPGMVQRHAAAVLAQAGAPPAVAFALPLPDGRLVLRFWVVGEPVALDFVFADGCLAAASYAPAPL